MATESWSMAFKKFSLRHSLLLLSLLFPICASIDTITPVQSLHEGQTLISAAGDYAFGFFTPGNSSSRYLGIWCKRASSEKRYVWVANRENPLSNISRLVVSIANDGNLAVSIPGRMPVFLITNASAAESQTTATLLDSGNLVLRDGRGNWLWQSFDFPTNTLLPGMKLGLDRRTGRARTITSWKSENDPGIGDYEVRLRTDWAPQLLLCKGSQLLWRSGPWNGLGFSGIPLMNHQSVVTYHIINDSDGIYYSYDLNSNSVLSRLLVESSGQVQRLAWVEGTTKWKLFWEAPTDRCDTYALCGAFSICEVSRVQMCECLQGFRPRQPQEWSMRDWAAGCVRRGELSCGKGHGFRKMENVKLPDGKAARLVRGLSSLRECRDECLKNCSCSAYAGADIDKWAGNCLIWEGELTDLKQYTDGANDLYVRSAASEINSSWKRKKPVLILIFTIIPPILLVLYCVYFLWKRDYMEKGSVAGTGSESERRREKSGLLDESGKSSEMPLFDLSVVMLATNFFSDSNKLGEGGFGPVYKGELKNGRHIAVKRLASNSGQGTEEFKNEVTLIQQLQHRNLVRILGCCTEGEEKMLIYEYMENKSLDFLLFDKKRQALLDWPKRFNIIIGIARGVLYLHHDSRLTIIHRDLKASNVLLDEEMSPRISDFGMARIFGGNQTQANTNRVVGTYGYMSPEYAIHGLFSVKSDVFSFGVLLLEIVSGKRNSSYYRHDGTLIGHAWEMWKEGRSLELVDSTIADSCSTSEVMRCVHVGLLCVEEHSINRPTMLSVVSMLSNETAMPPPKKPAYSSKKHFLDPDSSANWVETRTTNDLTITELAAR